MVMPHEIRKEASRVEQILKIPHQKRVEVQNVLNSAVNVFKLTAEVKDLSRQLKVEIKEYEAASTEANARVVADILSQRSKAKEELSTAKKDFMMATDNYISLGGTAEAVEAEDGK